MLFYTGGVKFVISNDSVYRGQISEAVGREGAGTRRTVNILRPKAKDSEFAPRGCGPRWDWHAQRAGVSPSCLSYLIMKRTQRFFEYLNQYRYHRKFKCRPGLFIL